MIPFKRLKLSASNGLNFSSGLHEEFPIKIKLMITSKALLKEDRNTHSVIGYVQRPIGK